MSVSIIQERLSTYECKTVIDQENALKEIAQEIALMALSRSGFFRYAAFQGGTCLRILYGLPRFSEDLDFVLENQDKSFFWEKFIQNMQEEFDAYGYTLEVKDRSKAESTVKNAFLKANSKGGVLLIRDTRTNQPKLRIKLEIDTNPPLGSEFELKYLDFPLPYSVRTQSLPSLFAGKCHALLCRNYAKGRDWFDFVWYVSRKTTINFNLLKNAINQSGPWQSKTIEVTPEWLVSELKIKIREIDWLKAKNDIARFLRPRELLTLEYWSEDFFLTQLDKLNIYLASY